MTKSEYLEFVQEALSFPSDMKDHVVHMDARPGLYPVDPAFVLRESEEMCRALQRAHAEYCHQVAMILFPEREMDLRKENLDQQLMWLYDDMARKASGPENRALDIMKKSAEIEPCCDGICTGACTR